MFSYVPQLPAIVKRAKKLKKLLLNKESIIAIPDTNTNTEKENHLKAFLI